MSSALVGLGIGIGFMVVIGLVFWVLLVIANWKIFTKAGEGGWKSIIPFYSLYITYKICWQTKMFWFSMLFAVLYGIFSSLNGSAIWTYVGYACVIVQIVITVEMLYKLAKSFGHGIGYTLGLIFLPNIFTLILGFGGDQYQGPQ